MALTEKQYEARKAAVMRKHGLSEAQYDQNPGEAFPGEREYLLRMNPPGSKPSAMLPLLFVIAGGIAILMMGGCAVGPVAMVLGLGAVLSAGAGILPLAALFFALSMWAKWNDK